MKKKEQAAPHADALDHEKHVFKVNCFKKVLGNYNRLFNLYIEAVYSDS